MTDARLPGRWLTAPALDGLSDAAFRVFANGLMHSADSESDGAIEQRALRWLHPDPTVLERAASELVDASLWSPTPSGFQVCNWSETQSTRAQMQSARENNRARQQRHRDGKKAAESQPVTRDVTRDVTREHVGKARTSTTQPPQELPHADARAHASPRASGIGDSDASRFCRHNVPRGECTYGDPACDLHTTPELAGTPY